MKESCENFWYIGAIQILTCNSMKKNYFFLLFCLFSLGAAAQEPFKMTIKIGPPDWNYEFIIPTVPGYTYNYTVDLGNGTVISNLTESFTATYDTPGFYQITISGLYPAIRFSNADGIYKHKIYSIDQWGDNHWLTMERAFSQCDNLVVNATDIPDLSGVTDMSYMLSQIGGINQLLDDWDVSNVTNMEGLFHYNFAFNQPLNSWDVSNVTNMSLMFNQTAFNQPLDNWDVSNVTNMRAMFSMSDFNQPLNSWDVSSVQNMSSMFDDTDFNQPVGMWDISSVTDMSWMFSFTTAFNQPLNWDVSGVDSMYAMFRGAEAFNQNISNWDVSNVQDLDHMFYDAHSFNQSLADWQISPSTLIEYFVDSSGLDTANYDALLSHLVDLGFTNRNFYADELKYCNTEARNTLLNERGWVILYDDQDTGCNLDVKKPSLSKVMMYPIPAASTVTIQVADGNPIRQAQMTDTSGKKVKYFNDNFDRLDVSDLASGLYFLVVDTDYGQQTLKVIKE